MLRLARDSEDSGDDPAERVTEIQQALDELDEDFQPAGSIGSEIELFFDPSIDPFAEHFEEEEVIVDRVTDPALAAAALCRSADRDVDPSNVEAASEEDGLMAVAQESGQPPGCLSADAVDNAGAGRAEPSKPCDDEFDSRSESPLEADAAAAAFAQSETIVLQRRPTAERSEPDAAEPQPEPILVIEDGYDDDTSAVQPLAAACRKEYSRLFSTLRGSR
jgi:hypothetical protein